MNTTPGNATSAWLAVASVMPKPAPTSANTLCLLAACASEPHAAAEERGVEFPRSLALIPALNQNVSSRSAAQVTRRPPGERMAMRNRGHQPLAIERLRSRREATRRGSPSGPTSKRRSSAPPARSRSFISETVSMTFGCLSRQSASRPASGSPIGGSRTPRRISPTSPVPFWRPERLDGVQFGEGTPDMQHHRPAAGGQADTRMSTLEERHPKLVLEPGDPAADRRGVEPERLGRAAEVSGARRCRQIFEITDIHQRPPRTWAPPGRSWLLTADACLKRTGARRRPMEHPPADAKSLR